MIVIAKEEEAVESETYTLSMSEEEANLFFRTMNGNIIREIESNKELVERALNRRAGFENSFHTYSIEELSSIYELLSQSLSFLKEAVNLSEEANQSAWESFVSEQRPMESGGE